MTARGACAEMDSVDEDCDSSEWRLSPRARRLALLVLEEGFPEPTKRFDLLDLVWEVVASTPRLWEHFGCHAAEAIDALASLPERETAALSDETVLRDSSACLAPGTEPIPFLTQRTIAGLGALAALTERVLWRVTYWAELDVKPRAGLHGLLRALKLDSKTTLRLVHKGAPVSATTSQDGAALGGAPEQIDAVETSGITLDELEARQIDCLVAFRRRLAAHVVRARGQAIQSDEPLPLRLALGHRACQMRNVASHALVPTLSFREALEVAEAALTTMAAAVGLHQPAVERGLLFPGSNDGDRPPSTTQSPFVAPPASNVERSGANGKSDFVAQCLATIARQRVTVLLAGSGCGKTRLVEELEAAAAVAKSPLVVLNLAPTADAEIPRASHGAGSQSEDLLKGLLDQQGKSRFLRMARRGHVVLAIDGFSHLSEDLKVRWSTFFERIHRAEAGLRLLLAMAPQDWNEREWGQLGRAQVIELNPERDAQTAQQLLKLCSTLSWPPVARINEGAPCPILRNPFWILKLSACLRESATSLPGNSEAEIVAFAIEREASGYRPDSWQPLDLPTRPVAALLVEAALHAAASALDYFDAPHGWFASVGPLAESKESKELFRTFFSALNQWFCWHREGEEDLVEVLLEGLFEESRRMELVLPVGDGCRLIHPALSTTCASDVYAESIRNRVTRLHNRLGASFGFLVDGAIEGIARRGSLVVATAEAAPSMAGTG